MKTLLKITFAFFLVAFAFTANAQRANGSQVVVTADLSTNTTDELTEGSTNLYNATHTGEASGATALTIADNVIDYANVDETLKQEVTDSDGTFDMNGSGIINATISSNTTFTFSNINPTRSIALYVTISSSAVISWNSTPLDIRGDDLSGDGSYLIHIFSWGTTESDLEITVKAL